MTLLLHIVNKYVDLCHLKTGCLLDSVAYLVDNALDDGGDINAVGNCDVQINDKTTGNGAHFNTLVLCLILFQNISFFLSRIY